MSEFNPELKGAIDDIWLERAKSAMRKRITENLALIESGHFSEDELTVALTAEEFPLIIVQDEELSEIVDSEDPDAWNQYIASHPEVVTHAANEFRLSHVRLAALDRQAVLAHPGFSQDEAIEAVLEARSAEIAEDARLHQIALQAAARNGFAV